LRAYFILLTVLLLSALAACTSKKKTGVLDDSDRQTSFWQNTTAKYNILYNSNLMLDREQQAINQQNQDNFQINIPVFVEPLAQGDAHPMMDSLIQKAYKIVNKKDRSKFVNDAYLVIGKAHYLKGSYYTATEYFTYLSKNTADYPSLLPYAYAWKARSLLQMARIGQAKLAVDSAQIFLDLLTRTDKQAQKLICAVQARYQIEIEKPLEAIPYLEQAVKLSANFDEKARWKFLLAQLYQDKGEDQIAYDRYKKLANSNVSFEMAFEADIQAAYLKGNQGLSLKYRIDPLLEMLKDGKNMDFKDQIYYQIGRLYYSEGRHEEAINYFNKSLAQESNNNYQLSETYLTLGDLYFADLKFPIAQENYAKAGAVLPQDYTNVRFIQRKLAHMDKLIAWNEEKYYQDTLLQLAKYSQDVRIQTIQEYAQNKLEDKLKEIQEAKGLAKNKAIESSFLKRSNAGVQSAGSAANGNTFYFNNADAMSLGASDFKRKWGNRQQGDNWRYTRDTYQLAPASSSNNQAAAGIGPGTLNSVRRQINKKNTEG